MSPDHRRFLHWDRPALPAAAGALADSYAVGDLLDLSTCIVAVPGARAGRRLKELLIDEAAARGLRLVPPRVHTIGALPDLFYEAAAPPADAVWSLRVWSRELRALPSQQRRLLWPHPPGDDDVRGWLMLARAVATLHRTVAGAGLRFTDAAARAGSGLLFDDSPRWRALAALQQRYADALARAGRADPHLARLRALELDGIRANADIWLIGVPDMPVVLRHMLQRLLPGGRVNVLVHAPDTMHDAFDGLGCVSPDAWANARIPLRDDQISVVGHPSNQAVAAAQSIAALAGRYAADEIVIGVPDEEVVPYVEQQLARAGIAGRYAGGTRIEMTAPFRLLHAFAELLTTESFDALAALARHPDVGRWLITNGARIDHPAAALLRVEGAWLPDLDRYMNERLPSSTRAPLGEDAGGGRAAVDALLRALFGRRLLGGMRDRARIADSMAAVMDLLVEVYSARTLSRDVPADRQLIAALRRLHDAAAAQHAVPAELDDVCDAGTAIRVLLDDVRGASIPAEANEAAVELFGWLELHLDDAPVTVITGMNEPFVPEALNADPFLPNALRTILGIEDNARRYARYAYQLTAMLASREHIHVVAGRRTVEGDPLRPSRLLLALTGAPLAHRVRLFFGEMTAVASVASAADVVRAPRVAARDESRFRLPPEPVIRMDAVPGELHVTAFRQVLADPYMFALNAALGREAVDDSARELDPFSFGSLSHRVLEQFGTSAIAMSSDPREVAAHLDRLLDANVAQRFGTGILAAVRLQVEQLRLRLHAFAAWQAAWRADGWVIAGVECETEGNGVELDVDGEPIRIRGRIDRIDHHPGRGEWAVFDYKTGEKVDSPADTHRMKDGRWIDLQLPLYRWLLPYLRDAAGGVVYSGDATASVRLGYIALSGDPGAIGARFADWSAEELDDALATARGVVRMLRVNEFTFRGLGNGWYTDDMAALLGRGRLIIDDDDEVVLEDLVDA